MAKEEHVKLALDGVTCPACGKHMTGVIDRRKSRTWMPYVNSQGPIGRFYEATTVRERRKCSDCGHRWTIKREE